MKANLAVSKGDEWREGEREREREDIFLPGEPGGHDATRLIFHRVKENLCRPGYIKSRLINAFIAPLPPSSFPSALQFDCPVRGN